jgi:GntR family transcriptional repressor for pyruvate dehydrogenase complex
MSEIFEFSLQRDKLYKQVADRLQQLIVEDSLRPGDKLPGERDLAEKMNVSRTVIREAIRALCVRGLVKVKSGCGTYVQELNPKDVAANIGLFLRLRQDPEPFQKIYEIRHMIEIEAAGLAAERATHQDICEMESTIEEMAASQDNLVQFVETDLAFHEMVAMATHNELFTVLLIPISDLLREFILASTKVPGSAQDGLRHHRHILGYIRAQDVHQARQAMRDHLIHARAMVESLYS